MLYFTPIRLILTDHWMTMVMAIQKHNMIHNWKRTRCEKEKIFNIVTSFDALDKNIVTYLHNWLHTSFGEIAQYIVVTILQ